MSNEETRNDDAPIGMNSGDAKGEIEVCTNPPALPTTVTAKKKSSGCLCWLGAFALIVVLFLFFVVPDVNRVRYAAEAAPVIGNLRTRVEIYRMEKEQLPGLQVDTTGHPVKNSPDGAYCVNVSGTNQTLYIQTMTDRDGANPTTSGRVAFMDALGDIQVCERGASANETTHVFKRLEFDYADLTGQRLRPNHFQYLVPYCDGENYCWVVGAFGDGKGLPAGTGYAVLEFRHNPSKTKFIATFERFKPQGGRLFLLPQSGFKGVPASGGLLIPSLDAVIHASTREEGEKAGEELKTALRNAGWDVQ